MHPAHVFVHYMIIPYKSFLGERIKDVDFARNQIIVRNGKGDKDRIIIKIIFNAINNPENNTRIIFLLRCSQVLNSIGTSIGFKGSRGQDSSEMH